MIYLICIPFILAYIMLIWFQTNALVEYSYLIRLDKIIPVLKKYLKIEKAGSPLNFKEYLSQYYSQHFLVRLVSCPICLSTWLAMIPSALIGFLIDWKIGLILEFPIAYASLFLYVLINKMIKI